MALPAEVTPLIGKDLVSPYQMWHGDNLSPTWCHLCWHWPIVPAAPSPGWRQRWTMAAAASISLLRHIKPLSSSSAECAAFRGARIAPAQRRLQPRKWGHWGREGSPGDAAPMAPPEHSPSLRGELPEPSGPASVLGTGGQPRLTAPAERASQSCITRRQARRERENANNRPGQKGSTVPPSCTASCSRRPPLTRGMLLVWDHLGRAAPAPPQPQRTDPVPTGAMPAHGASRALGGTGAPNLFPNPSLQPAQGSPHSHMAQPSCDPRLGFSFMKILCLCTGITSSGCPGAAPTAVLRLFWQVWFLPALE